MARGELSSGKGAFALLRSSLPTFGEHLERESRACDQLVESLSAYQLHLSEAATEQRAAGPRVSAALSRSFPRTTPGASADVSAVPISTAVDKPLRSR